MSINLIYHQATRTITFAQPNACPLRIDFDRWPTVANGRDAWFKYNGTNYEVDFFDSKAKYYKVAVIVESPHKDEFTPITFAPVIPLNGNSGKRFEKRLPQKYMIGLKIV